VAPEFDQSGLSHSLSLNDPLRLRQVSERKFAVRGTPSDAVIMGVRRLIRDSRPDLILSGVNAGLNVADDVTYSGTVAGAIEGTLLGIPSLALSQAGGYDDGERVVPWETAVALGAEVVDKLMAFGFPPGILYNVNFPSRPADAVTGISVTELGRLAHRMHIEERRDGRGMPYFWLTYEPRPTVGGAGTDIEALDRGAISITPLRLDMTARDVGEALGRHFAGS